MRGSRERRKTRGWTRGGVACLLAVLTFAAVGGARLVRASARPPADFTFVNEGEPSSLDPQQVSGVLEGRLMRFLYEGLVARDPRTLAPVPGAAESWSESADGLTWTFTLRRGARWSNGDELDARDFLAAYERLLDPRNGAPYAVFLDAVRGARAWSREVDASGAPELAFDTVGLRAPEPHTLVFELERRVPYFLDLVAHHALTPLPRAHLARLRAEHGARWELAWGRAENVVTNGPYRLAERRVRDRLRFAKNTRYWDAEHVAFETVDALSIEHVSTMLNVYLTGGAGWAPNFPLLLAPELLARQDFNPGPYLGTAFYRFNVTRPPFDDERVRRALALAIDRGALVRRVTRAGETPQWSFVPPCVRDYTPVELAHTAGAFERDLDTARALLAQAGYGPGQRVLPPLEISFNTQANNKDVAEVIADGWRRWLGVDARLANREWKTFLDAQRQLDYDVSKSSWVGDFPDAAGFLDIFRADSPNNRTGWRDAGYDALLDAAERAHGDERTTLLRAAETRLLDAAPIAPLYGYVTKNLVSPRLGGFFENALDEHPPKAWYWKSDAELAAETMGQSTDASRARAR
jgi:oligopeptide transport system substrate-binding protein